MWQITEIAYVSSISAEPPEFAKRFRLRFPDHYAAVEDVIADYEEEAVRQLKYDLSARGRNLDRIVDQEIYMPCLLVLAAYLISLGRGDQWASERDYLAAEYQRQLEAFCSMAIWEDTNQDLVEDEDEITYTSQIVYTRGL